MSSEVHHETVISISWVFQLTSITDRVNLLIFQEHFPPGSVYSPNLSIYTETTTTTRTELQSSRERFNHFPSREFLHSPPRNAQPRRRRTFFMQPRSRRGRLEFRRAPPSITNMPIHTATRASGLHTRPGTPRSAAVYWQFKWARRDWLASNYLLVHATPRRAPFSSRPRGHTAPSLRALSVISRDHRGP